MGGCSGGYEWSHCNGPVGCFFAVYDGGGEEQKMVIGVKVFMYF